MPTVWPLGSTTSRPRAAGLPFLTGSTVTVTSSPGLKVRMLQPRSIMSARLFVSATQCTTMPLLSFTSNFSQQCGFAQTHSVTVPFRVTFFPTSNAALPWCANSGIDTIKAPTASAKTTEHLLLTVDLRLRSNFILPLFALLAIHTAGLVAILFVVLFLFRGYAHHFDDVVIGRLQPHGGFDKNRRAGNRAGHTYFSDRYSATRERRRIRTAPYETLAPPAPK